VESHPFARYRSEGDWADGVRPLHICETPDDVRRACKQGDRPQLACAYCAARYRVEAKTPDKALAWFSTHPCDEGVPIDQWLAT